MGGQNSLLPVCTLLHTLLGNSCRTMKRHITLLILVTLAWNSIALCNEIYYAAMNGDLEKIKALLRANPGLVNSKEKDGETPLFAAQGNKDVAQLLLDNKADVNAQDNDGDTPLLFAAGGGYKEVVQLLLDRKADVNLTDYHRMTPLHMAVLSGNKDVVALLLDRNPDLNAKNDDGQTALEFAVSKGREDVVELLRQRGVPSEEQPSASLSNQATPAKNVRALAVVDTAGHSITISNPTLVHYIGRSSYQAEGVAAPTYVTENGQICLNQDWLWLNCPTSEISSIHRISPDPKKYYKSLQLSCPSVCKIPFDLELFDNPFEITFKDGSTIKANINGIICGTENAAPIVIYSSEVNDVAFQSDGTATFRLKSGKMQSGVSNISSQQDGSMNETFDHYHTAAYPEVVINTSSKSEGGISVALTPFNIDDFDGDMGGVVSNGPDNPGLSPELSGRVVRFSAKDMTSKDDHVFHITGLTNEVVDGKLAWIKTSLEFHQSSLECIEAVCTVNQCKARIFTPIGFIENLEYSVSPKSGIKSLRLQCGKDSVEFNDLQDVVYWYRGCASGFDDSESAESFPFQTGDSEVRIPFEEIQSLSRSKSTITTIVLKSGKTYIGKVSDEIATSYAINGTLVGGFGGFPAAGCLLLSNVNSLNSADFTKAN